MGPWLLVSGVVLLVLGALAVVDVIREDDPRTTRPSARISMPRSGPAGRPDTDRATQESAAADGHGAHGPRAAWALLLPVAAVLLVPAAPLGSFTATRIDASTPVAASDALYPPLRGSRGPGNGRFRC